MTVSPRSASGERSGPRWPKGVPDSWRLRRLVLGQQIVLGVAVSLERVRPHAKPQEDRQVQEIPEARRALGQLSGQPIMDKGRTCHDRQQQDGQKHERALKAVGLARPT